jgi:hypothetical protein
VALQGGAQGDAERSKMRARHLCVKGRGSGSAGNGPSLPPKAAKTHGLANGAESSSPRYFPVLDGGLLEGFYLPTQHDGVSFNAWMQRKAEHNVMQAAVRRAPRR